MKKTILSVLIIPLLAMCLYGVFFPSIDEKSIAPALGFIIGVGLLGDIYND